VIIEEAILKVRAGVERGESFVDPLKATEVFPHMVAQMVGIGEQTRRLGCDARKDRRLLRTGSRRAQLQTC
jgi:type II secretory pathway component PulF